MTCGGEGGGSGSGSVSDSGDGSRYIGGCGSCCVGGSPRRLLFAPEWLLAATLVVERRHAVFYNGFEHSSSVLSNNQGKLATGCLAFRARGYSRDREEPRVGLTSRV